MPSSWQTESGQLTCKWADSWQRVSYDPTWMREAIDIEGSYLPPVTDFASHSPFGGAFWFEPITTRGVIELWL